MHLSRTGAICAVVRSIKINLATMEIPLRHLFAIALAFCLTGQVRADDVILIGDAPLPVGIEISGAENSPFVGVWAGTW
ncbi:MAG: hypothetical protein AAGF50_15080, partial [Pseudomonadota bacterium]